MDERAGSGLDSGDASGVAVVPRQEDELRFRTDLAKRAPASAPVPSGRRKSSTTTSGACSAIRVRDSATEPALPTTAMSGWPFSSAASPSVTMRWSSTIITLIVSVVVT